MSAIGPYGQFSILLELAGLMFVSVRHNDPKKHFYMRFALCAALVCLTAAIFSRPHEITDYSGLYLPYLYVAVLIFTLYICFQLTLWQAAYIMTVSYAMQHCMYTVWLVLCVVLIPDFTYLDRTVAVYVLYGAALLISGVTTWYLSRDNRYMSQLEQFNTAVFAVFVLVIFLAVGLTGEMIKTGNLNAIVLSRISSSICCLMGIAFAATRLINRQVALNDALSRQILQRQKEEYEQRRASVEDLNIRCHDLKYQIRYAFQKNGVANGEDLKEIERSIKNIQNAYRTGNDALDIVISEKARLCSQKEIAFTFMGDGTLLDFMKEVDIYRIFNNAIDNAIEAVANVEDDKKIIDVTLRKAGPCTIIHFENYSSGTLQLLNGVPKTSKSDMINHGFGVRSMKSIAEGYNGNLSFRLEDGVFSLDIFFQAPANTILS